MLSLFLLFLSPPLRLTLSLAPLAPSSVFLPQIRVLEWFRKHHVSITNIDVGPTSAKLFARPAAHISYGVSRYIYIYIYICMCVYVCMHVCIYIYIYMYGWMDGWMDMLYVWVYAYVRNRASSPLCT